MTAVRALCADEAFDPAWWDPDSTEHTVAAQVCRQCPLLASCRQDAREHRLSGMYGGRLLVNGETVEPAVERPAAVSSASAAAAIAARRWPESERATAGRRAVLLAEMPSYAGRSL